MNPLKAWKKLPLKVRKEVTSFLQTFVAVFGTAFFAQLSAGDIEWTSATLAAIAVSAARAAIKAAFGTAIAALK